MTNPESQPIPVNISNTEEAFTQLREMGMPRGGPSSTYPIRSGMHEPARIDEPLEGFQQSEPLTHFLDRYIPDWRELDEDQLGDEFQDLQRQFYYFIYSPDTGNGVVGSRPVATSREFQQWREGMIDLNVRYFPPGTAAYQEPAQQPHISSGQEVDTLVEMRDKYGVGAENTPYMVGAQPPQEEPLADFLDRYVPDWRSLDPTELRLELDRLEETMKFDYNVRSGRAEGHPDWERVEIEVHNPEYLQKVLRGDIEPVTDEFYEVYYYPHGTAAYDEPQPERDPYSNLDWQAMNKETGIAADSDTFPQRVGIRAEKDTTQQEEPLVDFLDRYIFDWREFTPEQLGDELAYLRRDMNFQIFNEGNHPEWEIPPQLTTPGTVGPGGVNAVRYYPTGTAAYSELDIDSSKVYEVDRLSSEHHQYWIGPDNTIYQIIEPYHHYDVLEYKDSPINNGWIRVNYYPGSLALETRDPDRIEDFLLSSGQEYLSQFRGNFYVNSSNFKTTKEFIEANNAYFRIPAGTAKFSDPVVVLEELHSDPARGDVLSRHARFWLRKMNSLGRQNGIDIQDDIDKAEFAMINHDPYRYTYWSELALSNLHQTLAPERDFAGNIAYWLTNDEGDDVDDELEITDLTPEEETLIEQINQKIAGMTSYGMREETATARNAHVIAWSNGSADWWVYRGWNRPKIGESVTLDANEILIYAPYRQIDKILKWLDPLPLYGASYEAKQRGIYDPEIHFKGLQGNANYSERPSALGLTRPPTLERHKSELAKESPNLISSALGEYLGEIYPGAGAVAFYKLDTNEGNIAQLVRTSNDWEKQVSEATYIDDLDPHVILRAQFASDVAFGAAKLLSLEECCVIAAIKNSEIIGLAVYHIFPDHTALIYLVSVSPEHQKDFPSEVEKVRGVGTSMTCLIAKDIITEGVTRVCLRPLDIEARKFWEHRGFKSVNTTELCVIDNIQELVNQCELRPDDGDMEIGNYAQLEELQRPSTLLKMQPFKARCPDYQHESKNYLDLKQTIANWRGMYG